MSLEWFPEPVQAYGAFLAEGALNVLGRPKLDPLVVLVRETVQNSWDARKNQGTQVHFSIASDVLTPRQIELLRTDVFSKLPPEGLGLRDVLREQHVEVLRITDRGTHGLTGPLRADREVGRETDFIDFVFNVGQPGDKDYGGGTYGFGKTISYVVSRAATVVIFTRTEWEGRVQSRLIACGLGSQYTRADKRYTGRHWWGKPLHGNIGPVTGRDAESIARRLGFDLDEGTGTSLLILAPEFGDRTPEEAMRFVAESITWHFWPKMVPERRRRSMNFDVSWRGSPIPVPSPDDLPPLGGFAKALRVLRAHEETGDPPDEDGVSVHEIRTQKPDLRLGYLALATVPVQSGHGADAAVSDDESDRAPAAAFIGNAHHVARMRRAELVVDYLPGPELPSRHFEWAGVFRCTKETDRAFAAAEPPTHDGWIPQNVPDRAYKRTVNVAEKRIRATLRAEFAAPDVTPAEGSGSAVRIANHLRGLIASAPGGTGATAGGSKGGSGGGGGGRRRAAKLTVTDSRLVLIRGQVHTEVDFRVEGVPEAGIVVRATASVATDDGTGREREPPIGAETARVLGFHPGDEGLFTRSDGIELTPSLGPGWVVRAVGPPDTAVAVDLRLEDLVK